MRLRNKMKSGWYHYSKREFEIQINGVSDPLYFFNIADDVTLCIVLGFLYLIIRKISVSVFCRAYTICLLELF